MTLEDPVSERIIGCAFKVHGVLGYGFLEKVYENALAHELRKAGLGLQQQPELKIFYDDVLVGTYFPDLLVEARILVEVRRLGMSRRNDPGISPTEMTNGTPPLSTLE